MLNKAAMAQSQGGFLGGALSKAQEKAGRATQDVAVKAAGASQKLAAALRDQRKASIVAGAERRIEANRAQAKQWADFGLDTVQVGAEIAKLV